MWLAIIMWSYRTLFKFHLFSIFGFEYAIATEFSQKTQIFLGNV
jgi:hypothetical protein